MSARTSPAPADPAERSSRRTSLQISLALIAIASVLGFALRGDRTLPGDLAMLKAIQAVDFAGLETLVAALDFLGTTVGGVIVAVVLCLAGFALGSRRYALQVVTIVALRLLGEVLKPAFGSPRPPVEYLRDPDRALTTFGYPSGHAFTWACIAGMLVVFALTMSGERRWHRRVTVAAVLLVLGGAFVRPWLGLHWFYDMVGGTLYGTAAVLLTLAVLPIKRNWVGSKALPPLWLPELCKRSLPAQRVPGEDVGSRTPQGVRPFWRS